MRRMWMTGWPLLLCVALLGCSPGPAARTRTWEELILELADTDRLARLDTLSAHLVSSHDPTGGNNDFNQYLRPGPPGWWVIADLRGPGYISRFWFTGASSGMHGVRFYFDGEDAPRIDTTIGAFCGGEDPFLPPLAVYENYCWINWVPIPYEKRVIVMVQEGGTRPGNWPRLFHQINYHSLPPGQRVASFPCKIGDPVRNAITEVRQRWMDRDLFPVDTEWERLATEWELAPGDVGTLKLPNGPAILRKLEIIPDFDALATFSAREALLRELVLHLYWDDSESPSVSVPLGDFFGVFWRRNRYESMYVGSVDDTFFSRFPMPFEQGCRLALVNESDTPVSVRVEVDVEPLAEWDEAWGYFHSDWRRTTPAHVGRPHVALNREGRGKFVGCMLSVVSADRSWWILEADESIRVDRERTPGWRGTGLEDYFNGGWYYQNAIARLLDGIPFKMPFRVLQYRFHLVDPVHFNQSIDVEFERGPAHASRGWMESVAYYYMDQPGASGSALGTPETRVPPDDGFGRATIMTEINNLERLGDYRGARDLIDFFLERYPDFVMPEQLRLRQLAYVEHSEGFEAARPLYEAFIESAESESAIEQAEHLLWFHEDPSHALLYAYCNTRTALFLNGQPVSIVESPERVSMFQVTVQPGENVLALQSRHQPYPDWVQAYLRTHHGDTYTTPDWRWRFNPRGRWVHPGFDDSAWDVLGGTGVKGPPEVPHIWVEPHAYVGMHSTALGIRPTQDWVDRNGLVGYRKAFHIKGLELP